MRVAVTAEITGGPAKTAIGVVTAMKQRGTKTDSGIKRAAMIVGIVKIDAKFARVKTRDTGAYESDALK